MIFVKNLIRFVFALAMVFALSACTSFLMGPDVNVVRTGDNAEQGDVKSNKNTIVGQSEHAKIIATYGGIYRNRKIEIMVARIAGKLLSEARIGSSKYTVTLLDSPEINAFALPGGYIYVSRGILALANDESELAAVLAHEISHVILRHARARSNRVQTSEIVDRVITSVLGGDSETDQAVSRSRLSLAAFSQAQELAADKQGVLIAARAGYDPNAAARLLNSMGRFSALDSEQADGGGDDFLSTHPSTPDRIERVANSARAFDGRGNQYTGRAQYLKAVAGLIYGESGQQGAIIGRKFVHPSLKFTFSVPKRFSLQISPVAVVAVAGENEAVRFDSVQVPKSMLLSDYLLSGWIEGLDEKSIKVEKNNNIEMARGEARNDQWVFIVAVVRFNGEVYRFIFAAKKTSVSFRKAANDILKSFREINAKDVRQIKKNIIRIIVAKNGDSLVNFAKKMDLDKNSQQVFFVLNELYQGDPIIVGRQYKIVKAQK